jgi:hypothetical protein
MRGNGVYRVTEYLTEGEMDKVLGVLERNRQAFGIG